MRAVRIYRPGPLDQHVLETLPDLEPGPGELVVDVKAAAVNYPDMLVATGRYQVTPSAPFTPGKEGAGVVRAVGAGVERVRVGDRVLLHVENGSHATQARVTEIQCFPLPDRMSFVDAVAVGLAAQTAWFALHERAGFVPGQSVLVTGASGAVGQAAAQLVAALGGVVLAAASHPERARAVLPGLDGHFIDLSVADLRDGLRHQVRTAVGERGVDIVIDTLGGDVFDASLRTLAWCGRMVTVGFAAGRIPEVKANYLLVKNIAASGLQWSDYRDRAPQLVARAHEAMVALWARGQLACRRVQTLPIASFEQAYRAIETRQTKGRLILTMD